MKKGLAIALILLLVVTAAAAAGDLANRVKAAVIAEEINVSGMSLADFFAFLSEQSGVRIVAAPETAGIRVDMKMAAGQTLAAVLAELKKRNLQLGKQRKDEYVNNLLEFQKKDGSVEDRFLDRLLTMALIEARSCERFKRLSENLDDEYMRNFYRRFMESEAGHYTLFITLAEHYLPKEKVRKRWKEWLEYEATVIAKYGKKETIHG